MKRLIRHTVLPEEAGRAVRPLARALGVSNRQLARLKARPGGITLDGRPVTVRETAWAGQSLALLLEQARDGSAAPFDGPVDILYEDDDVLVINKPAGLLVHPTRRREADTLAARLAARCAGEGYTFRCVTRLDKNTMGLLLAARHAVAQAVLSNRRESLGRVYLALVHGVPDPPEGELDLPIGPPAPGSIARRVLEGGAPARTRYRLEGVYGGLSLLRLTLFTGRTHQIRVHMAHIGHPVAGDFLYGKEEPDLIGRQALHCAELSFAHPMTGQALSFAAPLPPDMAQIIGGNGVSHGQGDCTDRCIPMPFDE